MITRKILDIPLLGSTMEHPEQGQRTAAGEEMMKSVKTLFKSTLPQPAIATLGATESSKYLARVKTNS